MIVTNHNEVPITLLVPKINLNLSKDLVTFPLTRYLLHMQFMDFFDEIFIFQCVNLWYREFDELILSFLQWGRWSFPLAMGVEISIDFEMSLDIVMTSPVELCTHYPPYTPINLSDHSSKLAWERILSEEDELRLRGSYARIPMSLISNEAKSPVRDKFRSFISLLNLFRWSMNGNYLCRIRSKLYRDIAKKTLIKRIFN